MLISIEKLYKKYNLNIKGILHIGAHECQELKAYHNIGIDDDNIIWIEADPKVYQKMKHIKNIYNQVISDQDDQEVDFMITNNEQSSSLLNLKEHLKEHPWVYQTKKIKVKTITVDTFYQRNNLDSKNYNFVNIDIQGAELLALKGMTQSLKHVDYFYLEVNIKELYENCALLDDIDNYLKNYGFFRKELEMTQYGWGDAFYIKE